MRWLDALWLEWKIALAFLFDNKLQTLLIMVGIAVGSAVIVFITALITGLQANVIERTLGTQAHLKVQGLSAGYGAILVLRDLHLEVRTGLTVVLGPNGAGKTTLLKALNGLIRRQGVVTLDGEDLPEKTDRIVKAGVALCRKGANCSRR